MMQLKIKATEVFSDLINTDKRFVLSVGSSRSSKTYSMMQWIIYYCLQNQNKSKYISVVRKSFPSLRRTVYREFIDMLKEYNIYDDNKHNRTEHKVDVFGNWVEFFSLNDSQKIRGAKRDILYLNEVNEIDYESAQQLFLRTSERVFMDENPSDVWHWSMKYQNRDDCDYIHSTYLKNHFLSRETIAQIESYKDKDENFWRVYGLGLPGWAITTIYTHYNFYDDKDLYIDGQPIFDDYSYGLDVGYGHAMALTKCYFKDDTVWVEEVIYQSALTSSDLIKMMKDMSIDDNKDIWVDAAAPAMIEDLKRAGFNAKSADKSVKEGIDYIKSVNLFINNNSTNLIDELKRYSWKTKGEQIIYEPVKVADDLCVIGSTLITTNEGQVPINSIAPHHLILTRGGWKKCLAKLYKGSKLVSDYIINGQTIISATEEHKILADNKWIQIKNLQPGMKLLMRSNMMDRFFDSIKIKSTIQDIIGTNNDIMTIEKKRSYIDMFGQKNLEKYKMENIYTTLMETDTTMIYQIYNLLTQQNTHQITQEKDIKIILNHLSEHLNSQQVLKITKSGENPTNVQNIIKSYGKFHLVNFSNNSQNKPVNVVELNIPLMSQTQGSVQISAKVNGEEIVELTIYLLNADFVEKNSVKINMQKLNSVEEVVLENLIVQNQRIEEVYDLSIDEYHEFFANNILLHNCDSFRYCIWNRKRKGGVVDWNLLF